MLSIFFSDLRRMMKDPLLWVWLLVMPVVFTYFTGKLSSAPKVPKAAIKIENRDSGTLGAKFVDALRSDRVFLILTPDDEKKVEADAVVIIPEDFSARLNKGKPADVTLKVIATGGYGRLAEAAAWQGWYRFLDARARSPAAEQAPLMTLREEPLKGGRRIPHGYQQSVPGNLITFVLVILLTGGAATLAAERAHGLLRRLASAPVPRWHILYAKTLSRLALAAIQIGIFVVLGATVFKVDWSGRPVALAIAIGGFAMTAAGIGMWLGATIRTPEAAAGFGVLIALSLASLGGAWWPLEVVSPPLQAVAGILPTGWAMNAIHSLMLFGDPMTAVLPSVLALYLLGFGALYLASRRLLFL
jgi:ABC-type multidrug transport system permease subunit